MKFVLARHCETDWNRIPRIQGRTDTLLNTRGKLQAGALANELEPVKPKISMIFSSDLKRASETAEIIGKHLSVPVYLDKRLRECNHGVFDGLTNQEAGQKYGVDAVKAAFAAEHFHYDFTPYGGESKTAVAQRHLDLLGELTDNYPKDTILLIGHGRGLNTLLAVLDYEIGLKREEYRVIEYPR